MIEVEQTRFGLVGNCMHACLASILELQITDVPDTATVPLARELPESRQWKRQFEAWQSWLRLANLTLVEFPHEYVTIFPTGYVIMGVTSHRARPDDPSRRLLHAVVTLNGRLVWDPHPSRAEGFGEVVDWTILAVCDPITPIRRELLRATS